MHGLRAGSIGRARFNLRVIKTLRPRRRSLRQAQEEIAMAFHLRWRLCRTVTAVPLLALISEPISLASQGPGGGPGTPIASTQPVIWIVFFGGWPFLLVTP